MSVFDDYLDPSPPVSVKHCWELFLDFLNRGATSSTNIVQRVGGRGWGQPHKSWSDIIIAYKVKGILLAPPWNIECVAYFGVRSRGRGRIKQEFILDADEKNISDGSSVSKINF